MDMKNTRLSELLIAGNIEAVKTLTQQGKKSRSWSAARRLRPTLPRQSVRTDLHPMLPAPLKMPNN